MNALANMTLAVGATLTACAGASLLAPARMKTLWGGFSRNRPLGWLLTAVALGWGMRLLWLTPLGRFEGLKPIMAVLTPVGFGLIVYAMDEHLAARALGALLTIVPAPLLTAARAEPSAWRLVVVAVAYAMAVMGMALVMSPHLLRRWASRCAGSAAGWRLAAAAFGALGLFLAALALFVY